MTAEELYKEILDFPVDQKSQSEKKEFLEGIERLYIYKREYKEQKQLYDKLLAISEKNALVNYILGLLSSYLGKPGYYQFMKTSMDQGLEMAKANVGLALFTGDDVEKDLDNGLELLLEAYENGHVCCDITEVVSTCSFTFLEYILKLRKEINRLNR